MSKKKILTLALCVAMAAILAVGTLAYFTDADEVKNTFTVGHVDIELEEQKWEHEGDPIMPGNEWPKDPTITVADDSEDCWVFAEIEMSRYIPYIQLLNAKYGTEVVNADFAKGDVQKYIDEFIGGINHPAWEVMNLAEIQNVFAAGYGPGNPWPGTLKVILGYKEIQEAEDEITVFDKIMMPEWVTTEMLEATSFKNGGNINLNVYAKAIQAAELDTLAAAYAALYPAT